jgi:glycosyltransferase involved in cell wall biosynthesis
MKRVLLISNKVFHYRATNYNYFAQRFREEGYEFVVRASEVQKNNPYPPEFDFKTVPFSFSKYKKEIEELRPAVVIVFLHLKDLMIWPLLHWLRLKGIPSVYWNKGINLEVRHQPWRNIPFYYIHSLVNRIILYSRHELSDIRPGNRYKVFVANNTINLSRMPEVTLTREAIKAAFGIKFKKVVLFVGRMRRVKKVEHLIEAFNAIDDPDIGCVIVGDQMDYDLSKLIKRNNVLYLGEVFDPKNERMSQLFKASDLFCIPGDVGLGMNEAFYWGLPVVTENGLQPPEIHYLTSGRSGFIVEENDINALREKILLLLQNDSLRAEFSRNARTDILQEASIEKMFSGFLDCVKSLETK